MTAKETKIEILRGKAVGLNAAVKLLEAERDQMLKHLKLLLSLGCQHKRIIETPRDDKQVDYIYEEKRMCLDCGLTEVAMTRGSYAYLKGRPKEIVRRAILTAFEESSYPPPYDYRLKETIRSELTHEQEVSLVHSLRHKEISEQINKNLNALKKKKGNKKCSNNSMIF